MEKLVNFITPLGTARKVISPIEGFNHYITETGQDIIKITSRLNKKIPEALRSLGGFYSTTTKEYLAPLYFFFNPLKEALQGTNNITSKLLGEATQETILKELINSNPINTSLAFTGEEYKDYFKDIKVTASQAKASKERIETLSLLASKQPVILTFKDPIIHPKTGDSITTFKLENKTTLIPVGNSRETGFTLPNFKNKFRQGESLGFTAILEKDFTGEKVKLSAPKPKEQPAKKETKVKATKPALKTNNKEVKETK